MEKQTQDEASLRGFGRALKAQARAEGISVPRLIWRELKEGRAKTREVTRQAKLAEKVAEAAYVESSMLAGMKVLDAVRHDLPELNAGVSGVYAIQGDILLSDGGYFQDIRADNGRGKLLARINHTARRVISYRDSVDRALKEDSPYDFEISAGRGLLEVLSLFG